MRLEKLIFWPISRPTRFCISLREIVEEEKRLLSIRWGDKRGKQQCDVFSYEPCMFFNVLILSYHTVCKMTKIYWLSTIRKLELHAILMSIKKMPDVYLDYFEVSFKSDLFLY